MVIDPVCKMTIDPAQAPATSEWKGQKFYFCSERCKEQFEKSPQQYAGRVA